MKILVIRLEDPGDILFTTPVIRCIRKQVPQAEIHYLVKAESFPLLQHNPNIDKLHVFNEDEQLLNENFKLIIDLQNNSESRDIIKGLGSHIPVIPKSSWLAGLKKIFAPGHKAEAFLKTVDSICRYDGKGLDYFIPTTEHISEKDIPASHQLGYIALVIGGLTSAERISVKNIKEFCKEIDHPVILLGDKGGGEISSADQVKIYNACGKFSFNETGDLVKRCKLLITYDKGMVALASALRKPVISIWTGNAPLADMQPFYPDADVMKTPPYSIMKKFNGTVLLEKVRAMLAKIQNSNSLTDG